MDEVDRQDPTRREPPAARAMSAPVVTGPSGVAAAVPVEEPGTLDDFETFFEHWYWRLVGTLTVAFGDQEMAAEAVQDAFVKAHTRWRRVRRYDMPQAWVRRVAINRLRDLARGEERRRRNERRAGDERRRENVDTTPGGGALTDLLERLPERQRTTMALYYVDDLSVAEIAKSMGISAGTVKAHLSQGRDRLRELSMVGRNTEGPEHRRERA